MGNCVEVTSKSPSPSTTRNCSAGTSTARTDSTFTSKFSSIGSSAYEHTTDNEGYPEGRMLQFPNIKVFTFLELKSATSNFRPDAVLGEGGFGTVYKGWLDEKTLTPTKSGFGMVVAVKKLKSESRQGLEEWQVLFISSAYGNELRSRVVMVFGSCLSFIDIAFNVLWAIVKKSRNSSL